MAVDEAKRPSSAMDPLFLAMSRARRRRYQESVDICTKLLESNQLDQAVWLLKCRTLTKMQYVDDTELEEEGIAEILLDENSTASMPRPGTSLSRPKTQATSGGGDASIRPLTSGGRPLTGFTRPGTQSRSGNKAVSVDQAFKGSRPGTSRPSTALGRQVRLGTASLMASSNGIFIDPDRIDVKKYATRPALAKALMDYLLYHQHNPRKALELGAEGTVVAEYKDWWWKARIGKCYYQLGLLRDAEKQFLSSLKEQSTVVATLELCKVYLRLDQPNTALEVYEKACEKYPGDVHLLLGMARVYDMLSELGKSVDIYKKILVVDASNIEAIACLASNYFYTDQPEIALRYYRRLLQMGVNNTEIWNNLGLCCFYASQYDLSLHCFEKALQGAEDDNMADVWYNIGQIAIGIGDIGLAYQAFKVAISVDSNHAESYCNLGVLELRKGNVDLAKTSFKTANSLADYLFEPRYNAALLAFKLGEFQDAYEMAERSLEVNSEHSDSQELLKQLKRHFTLA